MSTHQLARLVRFFESFAPADVARLGNYYTHDAHFKDPFNDVRGLAAVQRVYTHMFDTLDAPRFLVIGKMTEAGDCWLEWEMHFRFKSRPQAGEQVIRGASHLLLDAQGRIRVHRDYWDAAEEVYEKLPVLGAVLRWIKRRVAA